MIENIIVYLIIALCVIFLAKRYFTQWKNAFSKDKDITCCSGCTGCPSSSSCSDKTAA